MPWLDQVLHKNPVVGFFSGLFAKKKVSPVLEFALQRIEERKRERRDHPETKGQQRDFLARFLDIKDSNSSIPDL